MIRMSSRVSMERVGDDLMVLTHDGVVHKVTGPAAHVLDCVAEGRPVPGGLDDAVAALVDAGVLNNPGGVSRRLVLVGSAAAAAVGLTSLVLPMASAAASPAPPSPDFPDSPSSTITLSAGPLLFTADATHLYTATYTGGQVFRIDPVTNSATSLISGLANTWMATPPISLGTKLYAPNNVETGTVTVVNPTNGTSSTTSVGALPTAAVLSADNTRLFVLNNGGTANSISVIDTDNDSVVATITGFTRPWGATRTGSRLYVTNPGEGTGSTVSMVNMTSNTIDATITVGSGPRDLAITPDGKRAYVPNQAGGTVSVINTDPASGAAYNTVIATLPLALSGDIFTSAVAVAFSPDGRRGYVSLESRNEVQVIDTDPASPTYHRVLQTLATGSGPRGLAVWDLGAGQQRLFVANGGANTVSVFTTPTP